MKKILLPEMAKKFNYIVLVSGKDVLHCVCNTQCVCPSHIMDSLDISHGNSPQKTVCMCVCTYMCVCAHVCVKYFIWGSYGVQGIREPSKACLYTVSISVLSFKQLKLAGLNRIGIYWNHVSS